MSGQVRLFDTPVDSFRDWHRIGYVPQRTSGGRCPGDGARDRGIGRLAHRRPFHRSTRADREAKDAIDLVGLADRAYESVAALSGGSSSGC